MKIMSISQEWKFIQEQLPDEIKRSSIDSPCADRLILFLVQAEDRRFFKHHGFDPLAILRAIIKHTFFSSREGASTIEQQLVRVITGRYEYTIERKIREIILASRLHRIADKKSIAFTYLNIAYYGTKYQNLEAILRRFNMDKNNVIPDEICAEIVARLKYPEPRIMTDKQRERIRRRVRYIIERVERYEHI